MRRKGNGSPIANDIINEYKKEQSYKKIHKRQICKDKDCNKCRWNPICEDRE